MRLPAVVKDARSFVQSPDGTRLLFIDGLVVNEHGALLGKLAIPATFPGQTMWADDSKHLCALGPDPLRRATPNTPTGGRMALYLEQLGEPPQRVGPIPPAGFNNGSMLAACSLSAHQALLLAISGGGVRPNAPYDLADGRARPLAIPGFQADNAFAVSPDLRLVGRSEGAQVPLSGAIRDLVRGDLVASYNNERVAAFSWDGRLALLAHPEPMTDLGEPITSRVVDTANGREIGTVGGTPIGAIAQPLGRTLIVGVVGGATGNREDIWLVTPEAARLVVRNVLSPWA
jgi:hypothetical protein